MKKLALLISFTLFLSACQTATQHAKKVEKTNITQMTADVVYLASDELEGRDTGSKGIEQASIYLIERLSQLGISPYKGDFLDKFDAKGKAAFNVVGVLPGINASLKDEIIVVGAHYDHIGIQDNDTGDVIANGANDNATGTATVLALAEHLQKMSLNRTVVFALYSAEEMGLLGSRHLAQRMKEEGDNVVAVLNFEMTGIPMVDRPFLTYLTGHDLSDMANVFNDANSELVVTGKLEQAAKFNLFRRSDNYPFYQVFKVPAHTFSTFDFTNFEEYHKVGDESSVIDFIHMSKVVDAILPGVVEVINGRRLKMTVTDNTQ